MKVLVTGGAGFIGSHLTAKLLSLGYQVNVIDNLISGDVKNLPRHNSLRFYNADILDEDDLEMAMQGCGVIFHLAALTSVPESFSKKLRYMYVNAEGTRQLVHMAQKLEVPKIIFSSTCAIYGDAKSPISEDSIPMPLSPYAESKLIAEQHLKMADATSSTCCTILRYFNVYGEKQKANSSYSGVISKFIDKLIKNEKAIIYGDGSQTRDFVSVHDVVRANILASIGECKGETINIGTGEETSIKEIAEMLGIDYTYEEERLGDVYKSYANIIKAISTLGYIPGIKLEDGLMLVEHYERGKNNGKDK